MFIAALIYSSQDVEQYECLSIDERIKKKEMYKFHKYIYIYTDTLLKRQIYIFKKNEILSFVATWMELEGIMLSGISQRKTDIV